MFLKLLLSKQCHPFLYPDGCDICFLGKFGKRSTNMYFPFDYSWSCATDKVSKRVKWPVDDQEHEELLERSQAN